MLCWPRAVAFRLLPFRELPRLEALWEEETFLDFPRSVDEERTAPDAFVREEALVLAAELFVDAFGWALEVAFSLVLPSVTFEAVVVFCPTAPKVPQTKRPIRARKLPALKHLRRDKFKRFSFNLKSWTPKRLRAVRKHWYKKDWYKK